MYAIAAASASRTPYPPARMLAFASPAIRRGARSAAACHVAYPPQLLSAGSWRAVMGGLDRHFGTDASVEPAVRESLLAFLERHAGRRETSVGAAAASFESRRLPGSERSTARSCLRTSSAGRT